VTERAIFDLRLWVEGDDRSDLVRLASEVQRVARLFALPART
jgi:hypothetical protein